MPGRIKPHHPAHAHDHPHPAQQHQLKPLPHLNHLLRRQEVQQQAAAPPPPPEPSQSGSLFDTTNTSKGFVLNKQTIIWLVVVSVIVLATLIIVTCLLCRCKRRGKAGKGKHRRYSSFEVRDGRNEFQAWNRHAPPRPSLAERGGDVKMDTWKSSAADSVTPLRPSAAAKVQNGSAVMEPVVVDYAASSSGQGSSSKKSSRYYSNLSQGRGSIWKRISQIGRAY